MRYFRSEGEFWEYFKRFNALYGSDWTGWKLAQARSRHEDMFGLRISPGEMYFRKQAGYECGGTQYLSMASMEKILLVVMAQNARLNELGDKLLRSQVESKARQLIGPGAMGPAPAESKSRL